MWRAAAKAQAKAVRGRLVAQHGGGKICQMPVRFPPPPPFRGSPRFLAQAFWTHCDNAVLQTACCHYGGMFGTRLASVWLIFVVSWPFVCGPFLQCRRSSSAEFRFRCRLVSRFVHVWPSASAIARARGQRLVGLWLLQIILTRIGAPACVRRRAARVASGNGVFPQMHRLWCVPAHAPVAVARAAPFSGQPQEVWSLLGQRGASS